MINNPALGWVNCMNCGQAPSAKCKCTDIEADMLAEGRDCDC